MIEENSELVQSVPLIEVCHLARCPTCGVLLYLSKWSFLVPFMPVHLSLSDHIYADLEKSHQSLPLHTFVFPSRRLPFKLVHLAHSRIRVSVLRSVLSITSDICPTVQYNCGFGITL